MKKFLLTAVLALIGVMVIAQERIAVFPFEDRENVLTRNEKFMLYDEFSNEFATRNAGRFAVVERQDVDRLITTEMDFQLTVFSAQEKTAEMMRVQNATRILSGTIGTLNDENNRRTEIRFTVSLYTYPDLVRLPGGKTLSVTTKNELFRRIPELVQQMQDVIAEGDTEQSIPEWLEYYINDDGTITISGYGGNAAVLNIPSQIVGLPVTYIYFENCRSLTSVTLPSSVTDIAKETFSGCINLSSINVDNRNPVYASVDGVLFDKNIQTLIYYPEGRNQSTYIIPSSVTDIRHRFWNSSLTSVTIPSSLTDIDYWSLNSESLTSILVDNRNPAYASVDGVLFDKNIRTIISYPAGKTARTYTIPSSVTSIGEGAFSGCSSLTSITIPTSVTSIGEGAFSGCSSLTSINVDRGNLVYASVDSVLFDKNIRTLIQYPKGKNQRTYLIPSSVTSIGDYTFSDCKSLTSVTIPSSVTSIGECAFWECSNLMSVTIPSSVTSIGAYAFSGCESLTSVNIPSSVTSIGAYAFRGCSSLTSVTIPSSVTSIGKYAFAWCSSLTSVNIPSSVTSINGAFFGCSSLNSIAVDNRNTAYASIDGVLFDKDIRTLIQYPAGKYQRTYIIPSSVTKIGSWAFEDCTSLTSVTIPSSVTEIGDGVFVGCSSLTSVTIPSSVTYIFVNTFAGCSSLISITIPSSVIGIGHEAFAGCSSLTSITIPSSVIGIGNYAFAGCDSLTSVTMPSSVTSIGYRAFENCNSLTSITVDARNPEYASIDGALFNKNIQTLIKYPEGKNQRTYLIPSSVTFIDDNAFSGCRSLTSINVDRGNLVYASIDGVLFDKNIRALIKYPEGKNQRTYNIPSTVTKIEEYAFNGCSSLISINVDNRNPVYASVDGVLFDKNIRNLIKYPEGKNQRTYIIPSSVTYIETYAFNGCYGLTNITIPSSVRYIEYRAFYECSSLTSVTIPSSVTYIGQEAFFGCRSLTSVTLSRRTGIGSDAFPSSARITYSD